MARNLLWIMADQLRWDYLGCYGMQSLPTPNIDRIAAMGVRFDRAYVPSPICGPSRMSFYTGRYVGSHGASWLGVPLRVGEPTLGDHLRETGTDCVLIGKTHMIPDTEGMARLGIDPASPIGARIAECGFDVFERDDGLHPDGFDANPPYDDYLRAHGMEGDNPWELWANSALGPDNALRSGWFMENAHLPARVPAEHSETAYLTNRAIDFMEQAQGPWLCHLSYIKPHWPYLAPAPYNDMFSAADLPQPARSDAERATDHPVLKAWQDLRPSRVFARDEVRERVGAVYMGLIKQLDDELGRLLDYMEASGRLADTTIVLCSDHGDNLGDHWLGEKDLFYDCSARMPLLIADPDPACDASRGTSCDLLVEGVDLAATFVDHFGGAPKPHILEGRSLMPLLHGARPDWRHYAFSEYDYGPHVVRQALGVPQEDARLTMVFDGRWKYTHCEGFPPLLFDLETDPDELTDLGRDPAHADIRDRMEQAFFAWSRRHRSRITVTPAQVEAMSRRGEPPGILIGYWSETDPRPA